MRLVSITPVRSEDWIIGLSLRAALRWVDHAIVLNHASIDRTAEILAQLKSEFPDRITVLEDPNPTWAEMAHRQRLLEAARQQRATHVAIVDADEVLTSNLLPLIRQQIQILRHGGMLQSPMPCMHGAIDKYRADRSIWGRCVTTVAFADQPALCWQAPHDGYDFHHREPYNARRQGRLPTGCGGVMHLQFVYRRRLLAKHALYKMTEVIRWPGRKPVHEVDRLYNLAPDERNVGVAQAPAEWWTAYSDLLPHLDLTHEPWQEEACRKLWAEHGAEKFKGLDLFGVV